MDPEKLPKLNLFPIKNNFFSLFFDFGFTPKKWQLLLVLISRFLCKSVV